ncbi:uncharacterized protein LOC129894844 [Solanum dulcamara]|uniref:uncharacterized protein LOC129894844 n=1 Tax=Solanum dulcamara TaxID=45834 RepID=UPI002485ABC7|nr:uncharacterized protein LOC129894844 [Solanum dulcamara]
MQTLLFCVVSSKKFSFDVQKLTLLNTYLISTTRVKVSPTSYRRLIHKFYWMLDKETLIEHVKSTDELDKPLLPPTKINITTFANIAQITPGPTVEIDYGKKVFFCFHTFLLTLWDNFRKIEEIELEAKMEMGKEFHVILGRNIVISSY